MFWSIVIACSGKEWRISDLRREPAMNARIVKTVCFSLAMLVCFPAGVTVFRSYAEGMEGGSGTMQIQSSVFDEGATIPKRHTCDGEDVSPQLFLSGIPDGAKSLVLICDDPDAPVGTWVHWVLFGLSPDTRELPEGVPPDAGILGGATHGRNDFGNLGYGGPCPPPGPAHRYFFKLYAVDTEPVLNAGATKPEVLRAIEGHILAEAQLMGRYGR
jgi:Raf kinase inhibitor-like YbhB/YbcL family protein